MKGQGEKEFDRPLGLTIDESNGDIYICDCDNNRIQILTVKYEFKSLFGNDTLKSPRDIKLSREYIYVLDQSNPCLHLFNYDFILEKSVISLGAGMQLYNANYIFIDQTDNILISDCDSNSIKIFSPQYTLIHSFSVSRYPTGVTMDNQGRAVVVCQADDNCLQIY